MNTSTMSRREKAKQSEQRRELSEMMAHEPSRRWLRSLLHACGVFTITNGDSFADGQKSVGVGIIAELDAVDPNLFPRLLQEAANERVRASVKQPETDDV